MWIYDNLYLGQSNIHNYVQCLVLRLSKGVWVPLFPKDMVNQPIPVIYNDCERFKFMVHIAGEMEQWCAKYS